MSDVTIKVDESAVVRAAADQLIRDRYETIAESFEEAMNAAISSIIASRVASVADEAIRDGVQKVLAEGWARTNEYGEFIRGGEKETLKSRIGQLLARQCSAEHPSNLPSEPYVARIVREEVRRALETDFRKDSEMLRGHFREQLTAGLAKKIAEMLK